MAKYVIKSAAAIVLWLAVMYGFISFAISGDLELRKALSSDDYPRYVEGAPEAVKFPININTATIRELKALDGIGTAKAEAVISYREENGAFRSVDELINVSGIGESTLEKIREFVTI